MVMKVVHLHNDLPSTSLNIFRELITGDQQAYSTVIKASQEHK